MIVWLSVGDTRSPFSFENKTLEPVLQPFPNLLGPVPEPNSEMCGPWWPEPWWHLCVPVTLMAFWIVMAIKLFRYRCIENFTLLVSYVRSRVVVWNNVTRYFLSDFSWTNLSPGVYLHSWVMMILWLVQKAYLWADSPVLVPGIVSDSLWPHRL